MPHLLDHLLMHQLREETADVLLRILEVLVQVIHAEVVAAERVRVLKRQQIAELDDEGLFELAEFEEIV